MKIFTDTKGREWVLELNIGTARTINERLRSEEVDLLKPNTLIHRLADPFFTASVLHLFVKDQLDTLKIDRNEFFASLGGEELWDAQSKLMEEYVDFFPNPEVKENLRMAMKKTEEYSNQVRERIAAKADEEFSKAMAEM
ncbi:MAG: hypothetical protein FWD31_02560, partial [Planctomycetaceae bacterium]|nr:hypothetical protein [Planctomycetaceae bacterium]